MREPTAIGVVGTFVVLTLVILAIAAYLGFMAGGVVWLFEETWGWWQ